MALLIYYLYTFYIISAKQFKGGFHKKLLIFMYLSGHWRESCSRKKGNKHKKQKKGNPSEFPQNKNYVFCPSVVVWPAVNSDLCLHEFGMIALKIHPQPKASHGGSRRTITVFIRSPYEAAISLFLTPHWPHTEPTEVCLHKPPLVSH